MDDKLVLIWKRIAEVIEAEVSPDTFLRWFKGVNMVQADELKLTLQVPNNIYQLWIESNYMGLLRSAVLSVLGAPREIKFIFDGEESLVEPEQKVVDAPKSRGTQNGDSKNENGANNGGMNPRYTFGSFVVGSNNQFGHAAAFAVAQSPAKTYNPLFLYGGVGLGKTHLMQAVGQYIGSSKKGVKVTYLSCEKFTNEFIDAIQNSTLVKFRKKYRQTDVLLIDDIQFLAGKERSQEEFFHTFNTLFDGHKQIVLSSDRPPSEIANLEQRLVSRFEWGLTAELQPPDIETRQAILRKKSQSLEIKLEPEILDFLAQKIRTNVRRLEGALMRVASFASLNGKQLTTDSIEHLLKDFLQEEARKVVTIDQIQRRVADHYDVRLADMTSKRRPANIAFPRQIAMYLSRELTKASLSEIGDAFGGRDHGTVLHACKLVKERMGKEDKIRQIISFFDHDLHR